MPSSLDLLSPQGCRAARIYEHHWTKGDLVIWENLAVQHARFAFGDAPRTLQRATIAKLGYWEQVPSDLPLYQALQGW